MRRLLDEVGLAQWTRPRRWVELLKDDECSPIVTGGHERDPQAIANGAAARYLGLKGSPDPGIPIIPGG
jgi:hypothetical protein